MALAIEKNCVLGREDMFKQDNRLGNLLSCEFRSERFFLVANQDGEGRDLDFCFFWAKPKEVASATK